MSESEQANRLAAEVGLRLGQAVAGLQVQPGMPGITVTPGFPATVIDYEHAKRTQGEERLVQTSPIRFIGRRLIVEDELNGLHPATSNQMAGGATQWVATVLGQPFINKAVKIENVRRPGGGVLVWRYTLALHVDSGDVPVIDVRFSPAVNLVEEEFFPASSLPSVRVGNWDNEYSITAVTTSGVIYQLAGVYHEDGRVMIYRRAPGILSGISGIPTWRTAWFEVVP